MAIKGTDVIEKDHMADAIKSAESYLSVLKKVDEEIKLIAKSLKDTLKSTGGNTAKDFQKIGDAVKSTNNLKKESDKINKALTSSQQNLVKAYSLENKEIQRNRILTNDRNKVVKQQVQLDRAAEGSLTQLRVKLSQMTKTYDGLSRTQRENQKVGGKLATNIQRTRDEVLKLEKATGRGGRNVGFYGESFKKASSQIRNFAAALGVVGGVRLFTNTLRDAVGVIKDFDTAQGNLAAISGLSADEMAPLTAQAKELGATTRFTASQVSGLQLELAKLGFTAREIEASAEPILNLSSALGADLGEAAALTGSTLRAFNLDASEASRVTDILTASATQSATDFAFFNNALSTVSPVANAVNVSIEETTALLSVLANNGLDSSTSATGLRNIFLELAKTGQPLNEALDQILNSTNQAKTSFDLFGKRGASLGVILANNQEGVEDLTASFENAGGTAAEVAGKQLDTLQGSLDLLRSAWEGYILGADEAGGISDKLKDIVKFLADNLETILDTIIALVKAFVIYKTTITAITIATKLYAAAQKAATAGVKGFGAALKSIPFVQIAAVVASLIPLIMDLGKAFFGTGEAASELSAAETVLQEVSSKTSQRLNEEQAELAAVFQALKKTTAGTEARQEALDKVNERYGITLQNLSDEAAFVKQVDDAYKSLLNSLKERIRLEVVQDKLTELLKQQLLLEGQLVKLQTKAAATRKKLGKEATTETVFNFETGTSEEVVINPEVAIGEIPEEDFANQTQALLDVINEQIEALLGDNESVLDKLFDGGTGAGGDGAAARTTKTLTEEQKKLAKLKKLKEEQALFLKDLRIQLDQEGVDGELATARIVEQQIKFARQELMLIKQLFGEGSAIFIEAQDAFFDLIEANEVEHLTNTKVARIDNNQDILKQEETFWNEMLKLSLDAQKKQEAARKQAIEDLKKSASQILDITEGIVQGRIEQTEREIDAAKVEVDLSNQAIDRLRAEANAGNITAQQSIAAEEARQDSIQGNIAELEKKRARLLAITTTLQAAQLFLESGDQNGFAKAGDGLGTLLKKIPAFKEGTDNTGGGGSLDGDGGFLAMLHKGERVMPEHLNSQLGGRTNEELVADIALADKLMMTDAKRSSHSFESVNTMIALNGLQQEISEGNKTIVKAIKDIPQYKLEFDPIEKALFHKWKSSRKVKTLIEHLR